MFTSGFGYVALMGGSLALGAVCVATVVAIATRGYEGSVHPIMKALSPWDEQDVID